MSLTDLAVHIDKNEPKEFIHLYLKCLVEQYQLITPLDLDIADLNKSWEEILAKFRGSFSDEFCNDVANYCSNMHLTVVLSK